MIRFACSHCSKGITAPDNAAGKRAKCPGCQGVVSIPAAQSAAEAYGDFEVVDDDAPVTAKASPVTTAPRRVAVEDIPTVEAVDEDDDRPRRRSRRDVDDDDFDDEDDDRPRRRKRRRDYTATSGTPIGRTRYAICYNCGADDASKVRWTLWGGIIGPSLMSHVKCGRCATTYNGNTGKSNTTAITIYLVVSLAIGAGLGTLAVVMSMMK
jgi:hypothetical protein